jgi:hypothetical protein
MRDLLLGIGVIPIGAPDFYDAFPETFQTIMNSGSCAGSIGRCCSTSSSMSSADPGPTSPAPPRWLR